MTYLRTLTMLAPLWVLVACQKSTSAEQESAPAKASSAPIALSVTVDATGYHPPTVAASSGRPVHLTITRISDEGCGQQILFPSLNLRRDLPLNQAVRMDFTMPASGSVGFTCGMNMLRGSVVVQ